MKARVRKPVDFASGKVRRGRRLGRDDERHGAGPGRAPVAAAPATASWPLTVRMQRYIETSNATLIDIFIDIKALAMIHYHLNSDIDHLKYFKCKQ